MATALQTGCSIYTLDNASLQSAPSSDEMLFILVHGVLLVVNSQCMMSPNCVWVNELINLSGHLYKREGVGLQSE